MSRRWIRLDAQWEESGWLNDLSGEASGCWPRLLCWVKLRGRRGRVSAPVSSVLARLWKVERTSVEAMVAAATKDGAITTEGNELVVVNWVQYQEPDATATERKRRQRATSHPGHGTSRRDPVARDHRPPTTDNQTAGRAKRKRGTALPADWRPNEGHHTRAKAGGLNGEAEAEKFRAWHEAKGSLMVNWDAAYTTWLLKARDFAGARASPTIADDDRHAREVGDWPRIKRELDARTSAQVGALNRLAVQIPPLATDTRGGEAA